MTEEELCQFIKTVYYAYDRVLVPKELKEYAAAWAPYVKEFDYTLCQQLLPNICMGKEFPPRPWEIRIGIMDYANKITHPPTPPEAWAHYQQILQAVNNGTGAMPETHPVLHEAMAALGPSALNNQYDTKRFEELYKDKVNQWMKKTYWMAVKQ